MHEKYILSCMQFTCLVACNFSRLRLCHWREICLCLLYNIYGRLTLTKMNIHAALGQSPDFMYVRHCQNLQTSANSHDPLFSAKVLAVCRTAQLTFRNRQAAPPPSPSPPLGLLQCDSKRYRVESSAYCLHGLGIFSMLLMEIFLFLKFALHFVSLQFTVYCTL